MAQPNASPLATPPQTRVAVVTDSVAQVSPAVARSLGITVVPLKLALDGMGYRDGVDITPDELYRRMREERILPRTASPSLGDYLAAYSTLFRRGAEGVVCLTLSSRLSTTYATAAAAARMVPVELEQGRVVVVDTRTVARAEGFVVERAAAAAAQGSSLAEVVAVAEATSRRVGLVATVDTLAYLARGGRVPQAVGLVGDLVHVKPVLTIEPDGSAVCIARKRSKRAALAYMLDHVAGQSARPPAALAVMQADAPDDALALQALAQARWLDLPVQVTDFTPVMGGHTGPGLVGLAYRFE